MLKTLQYNFCWAAILIIHNTAGFKVIIDNSGRDSAPEINLEYSGTHYNLIAADDYEYYNTQILQKL